MGRMGGGWGADEVPPSEPVPPKVWGYPLLQPESRESEGRRGNRMAGAGRKGTAEVAEGAEGRRKPRRDGVVGGWGCFLGCGGLGWTGRRRERGAASFGGPTKDGRGYL